MNRVNRALRTNEREDRVVLGAETDCHLSEVADEPVAEGSKDLQIELSTAGDVFDVEVEVVEFEHGLSWRCLTDRGSAAAAREPP